MKARKILVSLAALALVAAISIGSTLAYLTSHSEVKNTFTVGNVGITMDEAKVNLYGEKLYVPAGATETENYGGYVTDSTTATPAKRVTANTYKLVPGHTYTKDPTIHVNANSEDCYLFVKIVNDLGQNEATIDNQMKALGWKAVTGEGISGVYAWYGKTDGTVNTVKEIVNGGDSVTVFNTFTFGNADPEQYDKKNITVTAYAIQADGLSQMSDADLWAQFNA